MARNKHREAQGNSRTVSDTLNRFKELWAAGILFTSVFLLLSLLTYSDLDIQTVSSVETPYEIKNFFGITGAYTAHLMFMLLGVAAYIPPVYFLLWACRSFFSGFNFSISRIYSRVILFVIIILSGSIFAQLSGSYLPAAVKRFVPYPQPGGILGTIIVTKFASLYLGFYGSLLIAGFLFITASLIIADGRPIFVMRWIAVKLFKLFVIFYNSVISIITYCKDEISKETEKFSERKATKPIPAKPSKKPEPAATLSQPQSTLAPVETKIHTNEPQHVDDENLPLQLKPQPGKNLSEQSYEMPPVTLLEKMKQPKESDVTTSLRQKAELLRKTLSEFGIEVNVSEITRGPVITRYELTLAPGIKVQRITGLSDDIALAMKTPNIRIVAPIPGKSAVGIEVPNDIKSIVSMRDLLCSQDFINTKAALPLALGKDISGLPIITDMAAAPHLLIAGATGSGKSVCLNSIIMSLLYSCPPHKLKFLMVDPKKVELVQYNDLPHMLAPVITNPKKASPGLNWAVSEMEKRYQILAEAGVRNIQGFNSLPEMKRIEAAAGDEQILVHGIMPYILIILDELADLMIVAQDEIEDAITRLAQLSRAVGIHLILATQRPSVNVITGVIKANFPVRISFKVSSKVDSRTVLDANGAEKLLGNGDFLFLPPGTSKLIRGQGTYVSDAEIHRVVNFIKEQFQEEELEMVDIFSAQQSAGEQDEAMEDELYDQAVEIVKLSQQASASLLQRKLRVGYARAARLVDIMEANGVVGPHRGSKPREILED